MEPLEQDGDGSSSWHQLPAEEDPSRFLGHTSALHETGRQHGVALSPEGQLSIIGGPGTQQVADTFESLQLEFQESHLSPALTLIPQDKTLILSESTLLQQTDSEFVPLRGYPDLSIAFGQCPGMSNLGMEYIFPNTSHEQNSLSQHPLGVTTDISDGGSSCCSLSQHSLSPNSPLQVIQVHEEEQGNAQKNISERQMEVKEQTDADLGTEESALCSLGSGAPVGSLMEHLEKDVCAASSSAVSSASETALSQSEAILMQSRHQSENIAFAYCQAPDDTFAKQSKSRPSWSREQPQGGSSSSFQIKTSEKLGVLLSFHVPASTNIAACSSSMQPDYTTDLDQRPPLSYSQSDATVSASECTSQNGNKGTPSIPCVTPTSGIGVYVPGLQRVLQGSCSQTAANGSFLTYQPVSQSTPAILLSRASAAMTKPSPIYSHRDKEATLANSAQNGCLKASQMPTPGLSTSNLQIIPGVPGVKSSDSVEAHTGSCAPPFYVEDQENHEATEESSHPSMPVVFPSTFEREYKDQESTLSERRVHSLPTLNYVQKVDAWKAIQSSSRLYYDNLGLQGFDCVPPKTKMQDSDEQSHMLVQQTQTPQHAKTASDFGTNTSAHASQQGIANSSEPESGTPRQGELVAVGGAGKPSSASPLAHSHSHSSLSTVVTSVQRDGDQDNPQHPLTSSEEISLHVHKSSLPLKRVSEQDLADQPETGPVKASALLSLGQFSDVSSNPNLDSALSSCYGEQNLLASVGAASSVVSLEVDNYIPYWTSRPGTPPQSFELNIEDRIPMYLRNLGIDQSPSKILNPFAPRGPIREPEFSPTDLCTVKGSVGTPTKSTQPSEGGSPQKEKEKEFSSSSLLSLGSSASLTPRLAIQKPNRPASQGSVWMTRCQLGTTCDPHTSPYPCSTPQESGSPQQEGSYSFPVQLSLQSLPHSGAWGLRPEVKEQDLSLVGSGTLQEIRRLLGRAESLVSGRSSVESSPGSRCYSESDASFVSLRRNTQAYLNDSSLSVGGKISPGLARSSSDSVLKESSSSLAGHLQLSTQTDHVSIEATTQSQSREENLKSHDHLVAPRRTEPEGCSAADPDKVGPVGLSVSQGNAVSAPNDPQQSQESTVNAVVLSTENNSTNSPTEAELGVLSDSSSESSLAARVAKLLQSESPVSMVTSRPSTTDPEESRAREWIVMKVSGRQCEALELDVEDRKRIEEIKRELLLHTQQPKWSSDSEGSAQSSVGAVPKPIVDFAAVRNAEDRLSEQLQRAAWSPLDTTTPLHKPFLQKALQDGLNTTAPLASITIATARRTPSPQSVPHYQPKQKDHAHTGPQQEHNSSPKMRQIFISDTETEIEENGMMRGENKGNDADKENNDQESEKMDWSVVQEVAYKNLPNKKDIPPDLDPGVVPPHKSHMSHIHVTLSPKPQEIMSQRFHSPASDSYTLSGPQTGLHTRYSDRLPSQYMSRQVPPPSVFVSREEKHTSMICKSSGSKDQHAGQYTGLVSGFSQITPRYPQGFIPPQKLSGSAGPFSVRTATVPTLLPYKPHGSTELFYMPQNDPAVSPTCSDTTMESSHTGSNDALPPHFATEILGSRELEDNNITPKHKEGIYSKRAKMNRESTVLGKSHLKSEVAVCIQRDNAISHHHLSVPSTSDGLNRGQGTIHNGEQTEEEDEEVFVPLHMEADYSTDDLHHQCHTVQRHDLVPETLPLPIKPVRGEEQSIKTQELGLAITSSLDQLWHRFSERYSLQETQPTNEGETSLLERLERLSRLLQSTTPPHTPAKPARSRDERVKIRRKELELRSAQVKETNRRGEDQGRSEVRVTAKTAWVKNSLRTDQKLKKGQENANRCPAERDESASVSVETSSSQSTIDTQRLLRAFGSHRVNVGSANVTRSQTPKTSGSMLKLYNIINKQKRGEGQNISDQRESEVISTDESTASADSVSSSSTYTLPSQRAISRILTTKRPKVKLVSKGIQAGDLEIVTNGTRRHTRDVGTTFPSPCNARDNRALTSGTTELHASISTCRSSAPTALSQTVLGREGLHKSNQTSYPNGVSWFVSADELKQDARKENDPQPEAMQAASQVWFEPYTRSEPWRESPREPLRERHIQLVQKKPLKPKGLADTDSSKHSALVQLSLQEALELHRPGFMSRSRERMKRLCLLAEERKMQAIFNREREELFNRPLPVQQPTAAPPPAPSKRVIPVKEMVQRSKRGVEEKAQRLEKPDRVRRIYAQLPEVQKRKREEKRKAEYRTYRLNAQLFNKKVTNHVLGRRAPWQ